MRNVTVLTTAAAALALCLTGCGDDTSSDSGEADTSGLGDAPVLGITAAEICDGLTAAEVGEALGLEAKAARPDDTATPQCLYDLTGTDGALVGLVVAGLRPDSEVGGQAGDAAFDYVLDLNRSYAGTAGVVETKVDAGDRAAHLQGAALHFGVVSTGGHLITVALPVNDADATTFEALLSKTGTELG